jgi:ribosomal protein S18 acetylase RimI-like enzyme
MPNAEARPQAVGTIWHVALTDAPVPVEAMLPIAFCQLGPQAADELAGAMGLGGSTDVRRRFEGGRRCYAARSQGALAAYGWVSFAEEDVGGLGLHLRFLPGEAYIWDCATAPFFRRKGLYAALLGYMLAELRAEGLRRVWIGADYHNQPSQAGIARAGFAVVADLVAAPAAPGERRRRAWLQGRPGVQREMIVEARRVYLGDCEEVWLLGAES